MAKPNWDYEKQNRARQILAKAKADAEEMMTRVSKENETTRLLEQLEQLVRDAKELKEREARNSYCGICLDDI